MKYLLDVNALMALLISRHQHHIRAEAWIASLTAGDAVLLCGWTEVAFIRVSLNTGDIPDVATGQKALAGFKAGAAEVAFVPDRARASALPAWVRRAGQVGDGHLLGVATAAGAKLATFDSEIPGSWLLQ